MAELELIAELNPTRGIIASENPLALPPGALVDARNILWDRGRLKKRRGFGVIKASGLGKRARLAFFFRTGAGDARLVAATEDKLYSYNAGTNAFDEKGALTGTDLPELDACRWGVGIVYVTKWGQAFKYWDGGVGNFLDVGATAGGDAVLPTFIRRFGGRLVGGRVTVGSTEHLQRVAWSRVNLPGSWDWTVDADSGYEDRVNLEGMITGLEVVGRGLAIFSEESVEVALFTGPADAPFSFQSAEVTVGTPAGHTICKLGPPYSGQLVFLGSDYNIHVFDGLHAVPVADPIHPMLKDLLEYDYLNKAWAQVLPLDGIYRLAVPVSGSTENNFIIDWHYRRGQFYFHELAGTDKAWSASCRWIKSAAPTWAQLDTAGDLWTDLDMTWLELLQETGWRFTGFLGSAGDFCGLFEGGNDGANPIDGWGQFAPVESPSHEVAETAALEILDDRSSSSTLGVILGASRDGAHFTLDSQSHSLAPTDDPFVKARVQGRWFNLKIANATASEQFGLRGWRLWGMPRVGAQR